MQVDEVCAADVADLGMDRATGVLTVIHKGGRKFKIPLTPATWTALEAFLSGRARRAGLEDWRLLDGPLLATGRAAGCGRAICGSWRAGSLARPASRCGLKLSLHSLRHTGITLALDCLA